MLIGHTLLLSTRLPRRCKSPPNVNLNSLNTCETKGGCKYYLRLDKETQTSLMRYMYIGEALVNGEIPIYFICFVIRGISI